MNFYEEFSKINRITIHATLDVMITNQSVILTILFLWRMTDRMCKLIVGKY